MLHTSYQRGFILYSGAKQFDKESLLLNDMQFGLFDKFDYDENGLQPVLDLNGYPKSERRFVIQQGRSPITQTRSHEDKKFSTPVFSINDIVEVRADYPKTSKISLDEWVVGYDGNPEHTITARKGDRIRFSLKLKGRMLELLGYTEGVLEFEDTLMVPNDPQIPDACATYDPCESVDLYPAIERLVKRMRNQPVAGGHTVGDLVDITPVRETASGEEGAPRENERNLIGWCLEVCDGGELTDLAKVSGQYPGVKVSRLGRSGGVSKYYMLPLDTDFVPEPYEQKVNSVLAECGECGSGYSLIEGGFVYSVRLKDEGTNMVSAVLDLPGAIMGTEKKTEGAQDLDMGSYTVVLNEKLSKADIKEFVENHGPAVEISFVMKTEDICKNDEVTSTPWIDCGTCTVSTQEYQITVPDKKCGVSMLEELRAAYPEMNIQEIDGPKGCQHTFSGEVVTNIICEEPCSPIYQDFYSSETPKPYGMSEWTKVNTYVEDPETYVGVRFVGKSTRFIPNIWTIDELNGFEDAVEVYVEAGYPDEMREGISIYDNPLNVVQLSRYTPITHMGYDLLDKEKGYYGYFTGRSLHQGSNLSKEILGAHTRLNLDEQYANISIKIKTTTMCGMPGQSDTSYEEFTFHVPYGGHGGVVEFANKLAAAAGLSGITE